MLVVHGRKHMKRCVALFKDFTRQKEAIKTQNWTLRKQMAATCPTQDEIFYRLCNALEYHDYTSIGHVSASAMQALALAVCLAGTPHGLKASE